jgi:hypothetical protein
MKPWTRTGFAILWVILFFVTPVHAKDTVYVTADNLAGTNIFGTLNLQTGEFTQVAQTTPLFYGLSVGPEGRIYGADVNTGTIFTISASGATTSYGTITAPGYQFNSATAFYGFFGLAYNPLDENLFAVNVDPVHVSLYQIGKHGRRQSDIGIIEGPDTGVFFSGNLALGPHGKLYFDFVPAGGPQLFKIDPHTGAPTAIGSGLGTDILTLCSDGKRLFGIDTNITSGIGIYVIDVQTGIATPTGVVVSGLPSTNDFYIDTAIFYPRDHERYD